MLTGWERPLMRQRPLLSLIFVRETHALMPHHLRTIETPPLLPSVDARLFHFVLRRERLEGGGVVGTGGADPQCCHEGLQTEILPI